MRPKAIIIQVSCYADVTSGRATGIAMSDTSRLQAHCRNLKKWRLRPFPKIVLRVLLIELFNRKLKNMHVVNWRLCYFSRLRQPRYLPDQPWLRSKSINTSCKSPFPRIRDVESSKTLTSLAQGIYQIDQIFLQSTNNRYEHFIVACELYFLKIWDAQGFLKRSWVQLNVSTRSTRIFTTSLSSVYTQSS